MQGFTKITPRTVSEVDDLSASEVCDSRFDAGEELPEPGYGARLRSELFNSALTP